MKGGGFQKTFNATRYCAMHKRGFIVKSAESKSKRVIFARFSEDEDLLEAIASTAKQNNVKAGFFFLIGTLKKAVLGYYKEGKYARARDVVI